MRIARISLALSLLAAGCGGSTLPTVGAHCPDGSRPVEDLSYAPAIDARMDHVSAIEGNLASGAPRSDAGRPYQPYRITLRAGERVRIDLEARYDTYLIVQPPEGEPIENDDLEEGNLNSRIDLTASQDGDYLVEASAYDPNATGSYRLSIARGSAVPAPPPPVGPELASGAPTNGTLERNDPMIEGKITDAFRFTGRRGDLVTIDLESPAFDTYLTVRSPDGQVFVSDDISGANLNSRVQATLAMDGAYGVEVSSYRGDATGAYRVTLDRSPRPTRSRGDGPVADVAGNRGHGRVFGVFVGIRDYGGETGDLPHCDEDATELARVLREKGVMGSSQQIVLTNAQATGEGVRAALGTMAAQVGEEDLLIFFYSGHGGQHAGAVSVTEPDGLDETIHLRGGPVLDDDLAQWMAPIRGHVLVALDSCYSGGFARDVVAMPRRVGIFASEEDTLSDVAGRYSAGGFLSYWLRLGVDGAADANRDGTLRVGELVDYLYVMFGDHRREMPTTSNGGGVTFQHLVVARGSVVATDLLMRYPE